jgi:hypothetical protein
MKKFRSCSKQVIFRKGEACLAPTATRFSRSLDMSQKFKRNGVGASPLVLDEAAWR